MFQLSRIKIYKDFVENLDFLDKNVLKNGFFLAKKRLIKLKYSKSNKILDFFFAELFINQRVLVNDNDLEFTTYIRKDKLSLLSEQYLSLLLRKPWSKKLVFKLESLISIFSSICIKSVMQDEKIYFLIDGL